ncbi:hypothetical protein D3C73_1499200 [compost metagenome]
MVAIRARDRRTVVDVFQAILQLTDAGLTLHQIVLEVAQFTLLVTVGVTVQVRGVFDDHVV